METDTSTLTAFVTKYKPKLIDRLITRQMVKEAESLGVSLTCTFHISDSGDLVDRLTVRMKDAVSSC